MCVDATYSKWIECHKFVWFCYLLPFFGGICYYFKSDDIICDLLNDLPSYFTYKYQQSFYNIIPILIRSDNSHIGCNGKENEKCFENWRQSESEDELKDSFVNDDAFDSDEKKIFCHSQWRGK